MGVATEGVILKEAKETNRLLGAILEQLRELNTNLARAATGQPPYPARPGYPGDQYRGPR